MIHPASLFVTAVVAASVAQAVDESSFVGNTTSGNDEIVGGIEAQTGQHLYLTGLRGSPTAPAFCGGSLIAPTIVLTAAHCVDKGVGFVSIGSHFKSGADPKGERIEVARITTHPKYNVEAQFDFDFAIVELKTPSKTKPIELLLDDNEFNQAGVISKVRGWGNVIYNGTSSHELKEVSMRIWDNAKCQDALRKFNSNTRVTRSMLCAGGIRGQGSCQGDSGGPLTVVKNGKEVLAGLVSWAFECALENSPTAFSRVSQAKDFIQPFLK